MNTSQTKLDVIEFTALLHGAIAAADVESAAELADALAPVLGELVFSVIEEQVGPLHDELHALRHRLRAIENAVQEHAA